MALTLWEFYLLSNSLWTSLSTFLWTVHLCTSLIFVILRPTLTEHKLVFTIQVCNYLLCFNIWKKSALASSDNKRCWDRTWKCLMCLRWWDSVVLILRKLFSFPSCFPFVSLWQMCKSYLWSHLLSLLFWFQRSLALWGKDNAFALFYLSQYLLQSEDSIKRSCSECKEQLWYSLCCHQELIFGHDRSLL